MTFGVARRNTAHPPAMAWPLVIFDWTTGLLPDGFTYGGGGNGTKWNAAGLLVAGSNGRIFYDPATRLCEGIIGEEARTNVCLQSQALNNASWGNFQFTPAADATASPDGTTDADRMTAAVVTNSASSTFQTPGTLAPNHVALSCFFKAGSNGFAGLNIHPSAGNWVSCNFNLSTTANAGNAVGATSGTLINQFIESVGNSGWQRAQISGFTGTTTAYGLYLMMNNRTGVTPSNTTGDTLYTAAATFDVFGWQAQLEVGDFASSPIITTTASVTRSADTATSANRLLLAAGAEVVSAKTAIFIGAGQEQTVWQVDDGTTANRRRLFRNASREIHYVVITGGVSQCDLNLGTVADDTIFKVAIRHNVNDISGSLNGGAIVTDTSATLPAVTIARLFTDTGGGNYWMGFVRSIQCWGTLTDAELLLKSRIISSSEGTGFALAASSVTGVNASGNVFVPIDGSYALIFDEEFNGSSLDTAKWVASTNNPGPGAFSNNIFDPAQTTVSGGFGRFNIVQSGTTPPYRSAFITTGGSSQNFHFGPNSYLEARAKMPVSAGNVCHGVVNNIWGNGFYTGGPNSDSPEIDLWEWHGHFPTSLWPLAAFKYPPAGAVYQNPVLNAPFNGGPAGPTFPLIGNWSTAWHVIGMWWTTTFCAWYWDGVEMGRLVNGATDANGLTIVIPTAPICLIVNNSEDMNTELHSASSAYPQTMIVDYIHVYLQGGTAITPQTNYGGPGDAVGSGSPSS